MSVFIDSGFFVAFHNKRDANHDTAKELMKSIANGDMGITYTSDYIFDEAVTVALTRTRRLDIALNIGRMILGEIISPFIIMHKVNEEAFRGAWSLFSKYAERGLSFTDCTSIALMKMQGIEKMVSFDSGFDGLVPRIFKSF
ncbi:MAG: type II toxin-antitoxin system VapC family toxin [Nitrososphaerales archaeon]